MAETPYLRQFGVARVVFLTETPGARIWKATLRDGRLAALKIYRGATMRSEASGVAYMLARSAAVDIYRTNRFAILMEWLEGPSLGDLARDGKDEQAARELGAVAQRLMAEPIPGTYGTLPQMFDLLLRLSVPQGVGAAEMRRAQALADCLLADGVAQVPLHGDLHHDNVRQGPGGWTAFDAKGLVGDPAFELANAFRNPKGMAHADPGRISRRAGIWAEMLGVDRTRLLRWAAAKCAWSIALKNGPAFSTDPELGLLKALLSAAHGA